MSAVGGYGIDRWGLHRYGNVVGNWALVSDTPTTTWTAVRRQMATVIAALSPTTMSGDKYRLTRTERADFRAHAEENAQSVLREYDIEALEEEMLGIQNHQVELHVVAAELVMAYHHHWGAYRAKAQASTWNERTLRAVAHEDRNILDKAIGIRGGSNYATAQRSCAMGPTGFEEGDGVTFMVLPLEVTFFHSSR